MGIGTSLSKMIQISGDAVYYKYTAAVSVDIQMWLLLIHLHVLTAK